MEGHMLSMKHAYTVRLARLLTTGISYVNASGDEFCMPPLIVKLRSLLNRAMAPPPNCTGIFAAGQIAAHLTLIAVEHEEVSFDAKQLVLQLYSLEREFEELATVAPAIPHEKILAYAQETIKEMVGIHEKLTVGE